MSSNNDKIYLEIQELKKEMAQTRKIINTLVTIVMEYDVEEFEDDNLSNTGGDNSLFIPYT